MADHITPMNCVACGEWTLAGATSHGVVYAVTIETLYKEAKLWSYNDFQGEWKLLVVSSVPAPFRAVDFISAIYDDYFNRVDVFVQCFQTSYIVRFITSPATKLDCILSSVTGEYVKFDELRGSSLHYIDGRLLIAGEKAGDREIFRIYQVLVNDHEHTFTFVPAWCSNRSDVHSVNRMVSIGRRLLVLACRRTALCFTPDTAHDVIIHLPEPTCSDYSWLYLQLEHGFSPLWFQVCPSLNTPDTIWIVSPRTEVLEAVVTPTGEVSKGRILKRASIDERVDHPRSIAMKSAVASASHVFWIQKGDPPGIRSILFDVPTLEYLCLSKLWSMEEVRRCDSESDAIRLGIPVTVWRRYFG